MKLITTKFKSNCIKCKQSISIGERAYWDRDMGVIHLYCYKNTDATEDIKLEKKSANKFLLVAHFYMFIAPLAYGPVYQMMGMKDAIAYCLSFPLGIAIFTGLKPTTMRVRVKWTSRRAYMGDIYATLVLIEVGISYLLTWIISNISMLFG
jgi:hypothetical protein